MVFDGLNGVERENRTRHNYFSKGTLSPSGLKYGKYPKQVITVNGITPRHQCTPGHHH